jgi:uncharacterized protein YcbX
MRVRKIWRYPVKSMAGEELGSAEVGAVGIVGDRRWGVVDLGSGNTLTARREPKLLFALARLAGPEQVEITLPDGTVTADAEVLSTWLGYAVELRRAGSTGGTYEVPLDYEAESEWVSWEGPGEALHDSTKTRVSLVSTATLRDWDVRRFRPNVLLDGDGEDELVGRRIRIGTVELDVTKPVDRCVMVTRPQPGIDRDVDVLRTIHREREGNLAIATLVARPGRIAVGDELVPSA